MTKQKTLTRFVESKAYISKEAWRVLIEKFKNKRFAVELMLASIEGLNPEKLTEEDLDDIYIDLADLKERFGFTNNNIVSKMKSAIRFIVEAPIEFENDEYWSITPFFNKAIINKNRAVAKVSISALFMQHLSKLQQFLTLRSRILQANTRCIIFYGTLKAIHNTNVFKIGIDELQQSCYQKYNSYGHFKRGYLLPVIDELGKYGVKISFKENTIGKRVTSLSFTIVEELLPEEELDKVAQTEIPKKKYPDKKQIQSGPAYKSPEKSKALIQELSKTYEPSPEEKANIEKIKAGIRSRFENKVEPTKGEKVGS